jgi:hypothetical protein
MEMNRKQSKILFLFMLLSYFANAYAMTEQEAIQLQKNLQDENKLAEILTKLEESAWGKAKELVLRAQKSTAYKEKSQLRNEAKKVIDDTVGKEKEKITSDLPEVHPDPDWMFLFDVTKKFDNLNKKLNNKIQ